MRVPLSIVGPTVVLVPYAPAHVATYHEWMKDPYLLEMTRSEPLSQVEQTSQSVRAGILEALLICCCPCVIRALGTRG